MILAVGEELMKPLEVDVLIETELAHAVDDFDVHDEGMIVFASAHVLYIAAMHVHER